MVTRKVQDLRTQDEIRVIHEGKGGANPSGGGEGAAAGFHGDVSCLSRVPCKATGWGGRPVLPGPNQEEDGHED